MTATSSAAGAQRAARRSPRVAAPRSGRVAKPACGAARRKKAASRGVARAALTAAHADAGGDAAFTSLRLNSPGRMARVAATAAVYATIDASKGGRFRRGAVVVDALAVLPSGSPPSGAAASSWKLVPAASPRRASGGGTPRSPSVAAMLTSPAGGTATRRSLSPTRLDTPFVPPSYAPPKSSWAKAGGPLSRAANDWPRAATGGGGGGARGGNGNRRGGGGGGGGGGSTPTRRGTPPSPGPNRRGGKPGGRPWGFAVLAAVGMATGAAKQARVPLYCSDTLKTEQLRTGLAAAAGAPGRLHAAAPRGHVLRRRCAGRLARAASCVGRGRGSSAADVCSSARHASRRRRRGGRAAAHQRACFPSHVRGARGRHAVGDCAGRLRRRQPLRRRACCKPRRVGQRIMHRMLHAHVLRLAQVLRRRSAKTAAASRLESCCGCRRRDVSHEFLRELSCARGLPSDSAPAKAGGA